MSSRFFPSNNLANRIEEKGEDSEDEFRHTTALCRPFADSLLKREENQTTELGSPTGGESHFSDELGQSETLQTDDLGVSPYAQHTTSATTTSTSSADLTPPPAPASMFASEPSPSEEELSSAALRSLIPTTRNRRSLLRTIHSNRSLGSSEDNLGVPHPGPGGMMSKSEPARMLAPPHPPSRTPDEKVPDGFLDRGHRHSVMKRSGSARSQSAVPSLRASHHPPETLLSSLGITSLGQRQRQGLRASMKSSRGSTRSTDSSNLRASLMASKLAFKTRFGRTGANGYYFDTPLGVGSVGTTSHTTPETLEQDAPVVHRRYKPGDSVLICNHQSRWANLVNRHGFPPGEGAIPEEQRGPYIFVLATVKQIHFEEFAAFYTVVRADNGAEQRADADFMEPLLTTRGEHAARRAATQSSGDGSGISETNGNMATDGDLYDGQSGNKFFDCLRFLCFILFAPILWLFDFFHSVFVSYLSPLGMACMAFLRRQARLILNGMEPYACRMRITIVNFVVLCSTWYMFIDQARLAFFDRDFDYPLAIVNFFVWMVLCLELVFEVFIRPDDYRRLIIYEKAFAPTTVRFINGFHLLVESVSLAIFVPEFVCLFWSKEMCSQRFQFSFYNAALMSVTGPTRLDSFYGRAFMALIRLRVFALVRHWKTMWIANTFINMKWRANKGVVGIVPNIIPTRVSTRERKAFIAKKEQSANANDDIEKKDATLTNASNIGTALMVTNSYRTLAILWVITGLAPLVFCINPSYTNNLAVDMTEQLQASNLMANNSSDVTCEFLEQTIMSWSAALVPPRGRSHDNIPRGVHEEESMDPYLLGLHISPVRCFNSTEVLIDLWCRSVTSSIESMVTAESFANDICHQIKDVQLGMTSEEIANFYEVRSGSVTKVSQSAVSSFTNVDGTSIELEYKVEADFDQTYSIRTAAFGSMLLQLSLLLSGLVGLSVLRRDAELLVLGPLRRMLKIVARYAKNPLAGPTRTRRRRSTSKRGASRRSSNQDDSSSSSSSDEFSGDGGDVFGNDKLAVGSYETEQLITAVTKITDLLRKCWGVAGADIISTNLAFREGALTEVFNPTVPGKSVYALFAFAAINDFDHAQRNLGGDVMILINNVAAVLHGEVFRWGFGNSGQCNKNLGPAFLMVYRIGLVKEVVQKLEQAQDVIFSGTKASQTSAARRRQKQASLSSHDSNNNSAATVATVAGSSSHSGSRGGNGGTSSGSAALVSFARSNTLQFRRKAQRSASAKAMSLNLASLPGISTFTDRAVIGMLKSFAGIYRDEKIRDWNNDFRLGAGVGAYAVSMIYGMDAGWAVEGAVGSEYKIDATYLSPHVNMASRMTSACKQYGVSILLSQAVQELMSEVACSKLRHLDTVTVKGSSIKQKIYTYDARHKGVDFFLFSRPDDQADVDADRYSPNIWNTDQDLKAMRQHVTDDFLQAFTDGRKAYLTGDWKTAMKRLERANEIMVETALEEGYLEDEFDSLHHRAGEDARATAEELKRENSDGPSLYLLNFMKAHGGVAPDRWEGWHPLMRK